MKKSIFDGNDDVYLETIRKRRAQNKPSSKRRTGSKKASTNRFDEFMKQEVTREDFQLIPDEYFGITMFVLFLTVPKILGMAFFFFYVAEAKSELYQQVHTDGYLLDWVVGYEIFMAIALLIIGAKLLNYVFDK
jgi:hypothetical protein